MNLAEAIDYQLTLLNFPYPLVSALYKRPVTEHPTQEDSPSKVEYYPEHSATTI